MSVFVPAPSEGCGAGGGGGLGEGRGEEGGVGVGLGDGVEGKARGRGKEKGNPGGKGMGGRWLFVSHEALRVESGGGEGDGEVLTRMFGLERGGRGDEVESGGGFGKGERGGRGEGGGGTERFVRFAFEPMVCSNENSLPLAANLRFLLLSISPRTAKKNIRHTYSQKSFLTLKRLYAKIIDRVDGLLELDPPHSNRLPPPRGPRPQSRHLRRLPRIRRAIAQEPHRRQRPAHGGDPLGGVGL